MRPVVVEAEVDIDRPPEQVFDYCSDPGHEPEWNPMMKASTKISDGPLGVGARYATEFVKGPPMVMECVGYERPSAWSLDTGLVAGAGFVPVPLASTTGVQHEVFTAPEPGDLHAPKCDAHDRRRGCRLVHVASPNPILALATMLACRSCGPYPPRA